MQYSYMANNLGVFYSYNEQTSFCGFAFHIKQEKSYEVIESAVTRTTSHLLENRKKEPGLLENKSDKI